MSTGAGPPIIPSRQVLETRAFIRTLAKDTLIGLLGANTIIAEVESLTTGGGLRLVPLTNQELNVVGQAIGFGEESVGRPLFSAILGGALGPDTVAQLEQEAPDALRIIERVIGFTVGLPYGVSKLRDGIKALLGPHAPEQFLEAIGKLPQELGMNFFIPEILSGVVRTATERPLDEALARRFRPFRLEWPQLRALARTHAFDDAELKVRLANIGVRDEDMDLISKIDQQLLPVGDLQALYLAGMMSEDQVFDRLGQLGFSDNDAALIVQLYLHRAETAGGDQLRLAAQQGFLDDHLSEEQYRAILERVDVPAQSIELEVEAAKLRKSWQQHNLTLAEIKALTQHGEFSDQEAVARVIALNYAATDAASLVLSWHKEAQAAHAGLTKEQVLAYQVHGILTPAAAYDYLIGLSIRPADARFLVENPTLTSPVRQQPVTQAAVIAAYIDNVIDRGQAAELLKALPVAQEQIELLLRVADDKIARGNKPKQPHKNLSEAAVIEAFKYGLASDRWTVRELVVQGYSHADAELLVAIEITKEAGDVPTGWSQLT